MTDIWNGWTYLGGYVTEIEVGTNADGSLEVFAIGSDNALWRNWQTTPGGDWSGWYSLGSYVTEIEVGSNEDGSLEVFAIGSDNALHHIWQSAESPGGWSDWHSLGGYVTEIEVGTNADGRLEVFGIASDNTVWHNWETTPNGAWTGWFTLEGYATDIEVVNNTDGYLVVFAIDSDNSVSHTWQTTADGAWSDWYDLGGYATEIEVEANADGRLEVFAIGSDNALHHIWHSPESAGGWSGWSSLGGYVTEIEVGTNADGRLEVFAINGDNALLHIWQTTPGGSWSDWHSLGGDVTEVEVANNTDGNLEVFAIGSDNALYNIELTPDLGIEFGTINLPSTIDFGAHSSLDVLITNTGNAFATQPITIELWSSTDDNIDGRDVHLTSQTQSITLNPGESTTITINYDNITSAIAPGAYNLIAKISDGGGHESNNTVSQLVSALGTDVVIDWNATALNAIQAEGEARRKIAPTVGSRLMAILSTSVYDAVNAFTDAYTPYTVDRDAPAHASVEAAAVGAAYRVLTVLLRDQTHVFNQQLTKSLSEISADPSDVAVTDGLEFGQCVADEILGLRSTDGSDNNAPYVPPEGDYVWHPDPPYFEAVSPNWGQVTPWGIPNADDFAPDGLNGTPTNDPDLYAHEIEEVRHLGARYNTDLTTITRTDDQTETAFFWSYDKPDTFGAYGQLNQITEEIAVREGRSLAENARLFAALNVALADAAIVAWDAKYTYTQPRPEDVIAGNEHKPPFAQIDGIDATVADPHWKPLLEADFEPDSLPYAPAFPDYISGHSTFAGAFEGVLSGFFGDNYHFSAVSQDLIGQVRHFESFYDAAHQDSVSRIYGGVHVRESTTDGLHAGIEIGDFVVGNLFQPVV